MVSVVLGIIRGCYLINVNVVVICFMLFIWLVIFVVVFVLCLVISFIRNILLFLVVIFMLDDFIRLLVKSCECILVVIYVLLDVLFRLIGWF